MHEWTVGLIIIIGQTIITTIVGLIVKHYWDKHQKEKAELRRLRDEEEKKAQDDRCQLVKQSIHEEIVPLREDLDLMKRGMQKDIRRSLRKDGKSYKDRGWATQQEKTEFDELYWAYHNLGRNGVVDHLHQEVMELPESPEDIKGE